MVAQPAHWIEISHRKVRSTVPSSPPGVFLLFQFESRTSPLWARDSESVLRACDNLFGNDECHLSRDGRVDRLGYDRF